MMAPCQDECSGAGADNTEPPGSDLATRHRLESRAHRPHCGPARADAVRYSAEQLLRKLQHERSRIHMPGRSLGQSRAERDRVIDRVAADVAHHATAVTEAEDSTAQRSRYLVEHATDVADLRHIDDVIARRIDETVIEAEDDCDHYLRRAVGAPPVGSRRRQVWRDGARAVEEYRMTYAITDMDNPLGLRPSDTGKIHCCLMSACDTLGDVQRVAEWERGSAIWSRFEGADVFPGMCRVHRADLLALRGQWSEAERETARACEELREVGWIVGYAYNTIGQIRCRRGDFDGAATAYLRAEELGASPNAGSSMLLLRRGDVGGAMHRISRAVAATSPPLIRARLLPTQVEIAIAASDLATASGAVGELSRIAADYDTSKLQAEASLARARLHLANQDWMSAATEAAIALRQWQGLRAPYEAATVRVLHARACRACRALDDHDGWTTSLDIAVDGFRSLGAIADAEQTAALRTPRPRSAPCTLLTARETTVLQLRHRRDQQDHRRPIVPQPKDRRSPPEQHLRQTRRHQPGRSDRLRLREPGHRAAPTSAGVH